MDADVSELAGTLCGSLFLRASRDVREANDGCVREVVIPDAFSESEARRNDERQN